MLLLGEADFVLAGGAESMSQAPYVLRNSRWGMPLGKEDKLEDSLWSALTDSYCGLSMAQTAEKLGSQYGVTREQADEFAYQSQIKAKLATECGRLAEELAPEPQPMAAAPEPEPEPDAPAEPPLAADQVSEDAAAEALIEPAAAEGAPEEAEPTEAQPERRRLRALIRQMRPASDEAPATR